MSATDRTVLLQAGLARIAGYSAALVAEADRLISLPPAEQDGSTTVTAVLGEMRAMAQLLVESRAEIVAMAPPSQNGAALQEAGDALDVVVAETERAAFEIMNQAERAQAAAIRLQDARPSEIAEGLAEVNEATTAIVLACIFQDITGQRIRKVMSTLREIEGRIGSLVALMGISAEEASSTAQPVAETLLNGPSSEEQGGLGQGAVDDLFS